MKFAFSRRLAFALAAAASVPLIPAAHAAGTWQDTLQARDINGDGVVDAYYDTATNLTWLAVINAAAGSAPDLVYTKDVVAYRSTSPDELYRSGVAVPYQGAPTGHSTEPTTYYAYGDGLMTWAAADGWAKGLDVYGVGGWRLPSAANGELARLLETTLGNNSAPGTQLEPDTGPFVRTNFQIGSVGVQLRQRVFWLDDPYSYYNSLLRLQFPGPATTTAEESAWVVRTGDVPSIPEPGTFWLGALGLGALAWRARRAAHRPA